MIILVNGKKAIQKSGFSFEYVAENRLFLGRDGYTLSIVFPLKDCRQNIEIFGHIHRLDVDKNLLSFDCAILDTHVSLFGTLTIVKLSDIEVECQFSEGRCAQTVTNPFEDIFVSGLDLGSPPASSFSDITPSQAWRGIDYGADEVALPWVNENYPEVPNNWVKYESGSYSWDNGNSALSWQPYLIVIAKRICDAIGYQYDFSEWENSIYRQLIICNTPPAGGINRDYASILPEWTVSEFFEKLELFLMCEFDFDHKAKSVKMRFSKNVLAETAPVKIDDIVDSYNVELSHDDNYNCDYIASKRLAYKDCSHSMWNYYSCDWYIWNNKRLKRYETLHDLIERNKRRDIYREGQLPVVSWGEKAGDGFDKRLSTVDCLLYAADVDTYYIFRSIGTEYIGSALGRDNYTQIYVLQPVNVFGSGSVEDEDAPTEELDFVPVCIMDTYISKEDDHGYMMFLNPSPSSAASSSADYDASEIHQSDPASCISGGKRDKASAYYDEIYVAFWSGHIFDEGKSPYPIIDEYPVSQDWKELHIPGYSLRLTGNSANPALASAIVLPQIDARQKFKFSWIASEIPNPRAIFYIRGKRYLCEKITATFTEHGMSQLLKGEFYPLFDN